MESFPCQLELTVASALLLLSAQMPLLSPPKKSICEASGKSLAVSRSKSSCSSSATCDDGSPVEVPDQLFRKVAVVTPLQETKLKAIDQSVAVSQSKSSCSSSSLTCDDGSSVDVHAHSIRRVSVATPSYELMKLKVVRKSRTKKCRSSSYRKIKYSGCKIGAVASECASSESSEVASCLSTSSSCVSSAPPPIGGMKKDRAGGDSKAKQSSNSALMRGRADAIMRLLSGGSTSEVRIRQLLGDSPDTSKALRMLLKQGSVRRSGVGGRVDPFVYSIAS